MADSIADVRRDLHAVDSRVVGLEVELREHRTQSREQHADVMAQLRELRQDLSDQGRTPDSPPSLPPGPMPSLPGPAQPTLAPEPERTRRPRDESSEPGEIRISPRRLTPWLTALLPLFRALWPVVTAAAVTGGGVEACHQLEAAEPHTAPVEVTP